MRGRGARQRRELDPHIGEGRPRRPHAELEGVELAANAVPANVGGPVRSTQRCGEVGRHHDRVGAILRKDEERTRW